MIIPLPYNHGVKNAAQNFRAKTEDFTGLCYEDPLTYSARNER